MVLLHIVTVTAHAIDMELQLRFSITALSSGFAATAICTHGRGIGLSRL